MTRTARTATTSDVPAAAELLTAAFLDYPFTRHTIDADEHPRRLGASQALLLREVGIPHGLVHVVDAAGSGLDAVAVWMPPEATGLDDAFARVAPRLAELAGDRAGAAADADTALAPHRPAGPAWFLATVAVRPGLQGQGLGTTVLTAGLDRVDRDGRPAHLETSLAANVRLYTRLGFRVTAEVDLPHSGPSTWSMLRPATTSGP
ncbi:N-acetyltransferase [Pseudonocardia sp. TMWB2A]|uniref:GNAT family N-acetyltransferase n=1 Tax=Pseudonocardia sp. TMWB2A TaxID=687430 RepID=UPI00307CD306